MANFTRIKRYNWRVIARGPNSLNEHYFDAFNLAQNFQNGLAKCFQSVLQERTIWYSETWRDHTYMLNGFPRQAEIVI